MSTIKHKNHIELRREKLLGNKEVIKMSGNRQFENFKFLPKILKSDNLEKADGIRVRTTLDSQTTYAKAVHFLFNRYKNFLETKKIHLKKQKKTSKSKLQKNFTKPQNKKKILKFDFWKNAITKFFKIRTSSKNWNPAVIMNHSYILFKRVISKCLDPKMSEIPSIEKIHQFFLMCITLTIKLIFDDEDEIEDFIFEVAKVFMTKIFNLEATELELLIHYLNWDNMFVQSEDFLYELDSVQRLF